MPQPKAKKRKKVSQKELTRLAGQGAEILHDNRAVTIDHLNALFEKLESIEEQRVAAQAEILDAITQLALTMRTAKPAGELTTMTQLLKRLEVAVAAQGPVEYEFTFKNLPNGRYEKIYAKPLPRTTH